MERAVRACTAIGLVFVLACPAGAAGGSALSYVPLDHWSYQALDRLATLGLLPLHAVTMRPITRLEARQLLQEAVGRLRRADPVTVRAAQDDLRRLAEEFSGDPTVVVTLSGQAGNRQAAPFIPDPTAGASSVTIRHALSDSLLIYGQAVGGGEVGDTPRSELYASFRLGSLLAQAGRSAVWWGPGFRSSLLLSDNAGTFPMLRLTADLPRARLTKVVASLERGAGPQGSPAYLFATRLDWLVTPRFRLGVSETVVMTWDGPLSVLHAIHPLPVVFSAVASAFFHDILGQTRQTLAGVDFDWLVRPGLRVYGGLLIDDPLPLDRARVGLQAGFYMANPLGLERTGLRLEYSLITNGTYTYISGFEHAYRGRSLGHWLGPDGDDLYVELTRLLGESATLQLSYSYTRKGQGSFEQSEGGAPGLFLTGVVERRHTMGIRLHKIHSPSLETRYWLELASASNRGNVPGAGGLEAQAGLGATYRWPVSQPPLTPEQAGGTVGAPQPSAADSTGGKATLRTWSASVRSDRGLPAQPTAFILGVDYRTNFGRWPLSFSVDGTPRGDHLFWSADVHYPLPVAPYGAASVFAGLGGGRFPGGVWPLPETVAYTGPRGGLEFRYQVPLRAAPHSLYLAGRASTNLRWTFAQVYLWDYSLGAGWAGPGLGVEIGYRGIAAMWQPRTPDQTSVLWEGIYLTVSLR